LGLGVITLSFFNVSCKSVFCWVNCFTCSLLELIAIFVFWDCFLVPFLLVFCFCKLIVALL
jgi:hypothetical protein